MRATLQPCLLPNLTKTAFILPPQDLGITQGCHHIALNNAMKAPTEQRIRNPATTLRPVICARPVIQLSHLSQLPLLTTWKSLVTAVSAITDYWLSENPNFIPRPTPNVTIVTTPQVLWNWSRTAALIIAVLSEHVRRVMAVSLLGNMKITYQLAQTAVTVIPLIVLYRLSLVALIIPSSIAIARDQVVIAARPGLKFIQSLASTALYAITFEPLLSMVPSTIGSSTL